MRYYLHYVGSGLYSKEIFIEEANRLGVNRCLPMVMIKGLEWGSRILLATFLPQEQSESLRIDGRKNRKNGKAEVFGYFDVRGLNLNASDEFKKKLTEQLTIISSSNVNQKVQRRCGSYSIGASYVVKDSIEEIIKKAKKLEIGMNEKVKFFVAGNFYPLDLTIEPINFSRTLIETEIDQELKIEELVKQRVSLIYDYDKRTYIKKYEKRGRPRKIKIQ